MTELGGANGFEGALKGIDAFAQGISDAIVKLSRLATIAGFFIYNKKGTNPFTQTREFNEANAKSDMLARRQYGGAAANKYMAEADKAAALKLKKAKADELSMLSAKNKATKEEAQMKKDQAALDALKKKFDLERIGLNVALNQATDEETKARIRAQIAILDETGASAQAANDALVKAQADKLKQELLAASALQYLATSASNAASKLANMQAPSFGVAGVTYNPTQNMDRNYDDYLASLQAMLLNLNGIPGVTFNPTQNKDANYDNNVLNGPTVIVNTGPVLADENVIVDAVQAALNEIARRGNLTTYAGAISA
jgi:hypothetical protein